MSAASSSAAPWEIRLRAAAEQTEHSDSGSCSSDGDEPISAEGAGDLMVDYLMELLTHRRPVSARIVCTICWWASKAGAKGLVESFALDPTCQTGKFQAHLDKVSGVSLREDDSVRYHVPTALNEKRDACRAVHEHPVNVPHEVANDEILASPGILQDVRRRQWPEVFYSHPIVQKFPGECVPFALFIDGVPSTRRDGMLGVWIYNLATSSRHVIAVYRKSSLCRCGCSGWCTLHPLWVFLAWSFSAMATAKFPSGRHDQRPWQASDSVRATLADSPMAFRGVLLQIKGDWLEFASSLAFASWATELAPCLFCTTTKSTMAQVAGWGPKRPVFALCTDETYESSCAACEKIVILSREDWSQVLAALEWDRSRGKHAARGRALTRDLPSLGLLHHDRLEPDSLFIDVSDFDLVKKLPVRATFWRRSAEVRVKHRNYLLRSDLGTGLHTICIDSLHTLYMGPAHDFVAAALWACIKANIYGAAGGAFRNTLPITVTRLRTDLWDFYRRRKILFPGEDVKEVEDLTPKMFGEPGREKFGPVKASEIKHLIHFCCDLLTQFSTKVGEPRCGHLLVIGECLLEYIMLMRNSPVVVSRADQQHMFDTVLRLCTAWDLAGLHVKPKRQRACGQAAALVM